MSKPRLETHLPAHRSLRVTEVTGGALGTRPVVHPHASLALCLGGAATVFSGSTYAIERGDVLLVPEGQPHYGVSAREPSAIGLAACTACLTSPAGRHLADVFAAVGSGASARRTLEPDDVERLEWTLRALGDELETERVGQALAVEGLLAVTAAILLRANPAAGLLDGQAPEASLGARALGFITHNATRGISLVDVARHVHRSPAHTASVVKAETGRTVVSWITDARLAAARQLLLGTDDTVETIGSRVGFASPSHFHRTFRRHHQTTPSRWRSSHRG